MVNPKQSCGAALAPSLAEAAVGVLRTAEALDKAAASRKVAAAWREGQIESVGTAMAPARPARPARPELLAPRDMPRRKKGGSDANRVALLHALAHIELNAIDLAWDMVARFSGAREDGKALPRAFFDDWVAVADDEARHFQMLAARLADFGAAYGDLPAHDGLWEAAGETAHDLMARLAVVPMVLEARGLDVTPGMITRLEGHGDADSVAVLRVIYEDEKDHVATGARWFAHVARARGLAPEDAWRDMVRTYFRGALKPPFNTEARAAAGMRPELYEPLAR